jgi:hypothetical protein
LNASLLKKYLKTGKLTDGEMTLYEKHGAKMETPNTQHFNLENARAQIADDTARAKALGLIDTPMYHGTSSDFPAFSLAEGGSVTNSPVGKLSVSMADNPLLANEFATLAQAQGKQTGLISNAGANVLPLVHRTERPASMRLPDDSLSLEVFGAIQDAFKQGQDAVRLTNYTPFEGKNLGNAYLLTEPKNIRSRFAALDPLRKNSANILASGLLGTTLLKHKKKEQD